MIKRIILVLSAAGVLFSGYLSWIKLSTRVCAFNESCPYFLGYPACYFGFGMFLILLIGALWWNLGSKRLEILKKAIAAVSLLGILFAGYFTLREISLLTTKGFGAYLLGLPTCAWGLVFYLLIFTLTSMAIYKSRKEQGL